LYRGEELSCGYEDLAREDAPLSDMGKDCA
jgi:hypothetical protein